MYIIPDDLDEVIEYVRLLAAQVKLLKAERDAIRKQAIQECAAICKQEGVDRDARRTAPFPGDDSTVQGHKAVTAYTLERRILALINEKGD